MQKIRKPIELEDDYGILRRATFAPHPEGCTCEGRRPEVFDTKKGNIVVSGQAATDDLAQELNLTLPAGGVAVVVPREMLIKHLSDSPTTPSS